MWQKSKSVEDLNYQKATSKLDTKHKKIWIQLLNRRKDQNQRLLWIPDGVKLKKVFSARNKQK